MTRWGKILTAASLLSLGGPALAQASVSAAMAGAQVGERADGYLGVRGQVSPAVKAEVEQINIKRRAVYTQRAAERGVAIEVIAAATGCQTLKRVAPGQAYSLDGASWHVRGAGDPAPLPPNCPNQ